jgi:methyl-accepting chemotaxis protein
MWIGLSKDEAVKEPEAMTKPEPTIEFESDGTIKWAHERVLIAMGCSLSQIRGKHHSMFANAEYAASSDYREFWEALNRGERQATRLKRVEQGGKERWIEASYNPISDLTGKVVKIILVEQIVEQGH